MRWAQSYGRLGSAAVAEPGDPLPPLAWPEWVFSLTNQPSSIESAGIQSAIRSFMQTLNELDMLSSLGVSGSEYANKWGELIRWQLELRRVGGPQIQGTAAALVEELNRRVAARRDLASMPLTPEGERVEDMMARISAVPAEEWARTREAFWPTEPPPPEALPALLDQLAAEDAQDAALEAERVAIEADLSAAAGRVEAAQQRLEAARRDLADAQPATPPRLGDIGDSFKKAVRDIRDEARRGITTVSGWRDEVSSTFLPSAVRDFGRQIDAELRRQGRRLDRQLRRSVEDVALRYGPWLRIVVVIAFPLGLVGFVTASVVLTSVIAAEVSYTYHQKEAARRQARAMLEQMRAHVAELNAEAAAKEAEAERIEGELAVMISQRGELAAQLDLETRTTIEEIDARRNRTLLYGAGILGAGILVAVLVRAARG